MTIMHTIRFFDGASRVLGGADAKGTTVNGFSAPLRTIRRALTTVAVWRERATTRSQLMNMDERMLSDIGVDRMAVHLEAKKPFWRA